MNSCLISPPYLIEPFQAICRAQKNSVHNYIYLPLLQTRLFLKLFPHNNEVTNFTINISHEYSIFGIAKLSHLKIERK